MKIFGNSKGKKHGNIPHKETKTLVHNIKTMFILPEFIYRGARTNERKGVKLKIIATITS